MKFLQPRFSVPLGSRKFRTGWDRIFSKCPECGRHWDEGEDCESEFHVYLEPEPRDVQTWKQEEQDDEE